MPEFIVIDGQKVPIDVDYADDTGVSLHVNEDCPRCGEDTDWMYAAPMPGKFEVVCVSCNRSYPIQSE